MSKERTRVGKFMRFLFIKLPLAIILFSIIWVVLLKWFPVYITPLMISRSIEYRQDKDFHTHHKWRSLERISPEMSKAVIASEDNKFLDHNGFDWDEMEKAIKEHNQGKRLRGASTISQQTAKNVFLLPKRSFIRKGLEAYFTVLIELIWGKQRILEVYLNVAEMGKGLYGSEAAARYLFKTTADKLTRHQACLIAACLPNPLKRNAANPSSYVSSRANAISRNISNLKYPDWINRK